MNAVNLIPSNRRSSSGPTSLADSAPFLAVIVVLVLALVGTFLFVVAHDRVSSRRAQLARVEASTAKWQTAAAGFSEDVTTLQNRDKRIETVRSLAGARYDWSLLLGQLAGLMPKDTALTSLSATQVSAAAAAAAAANGQTSTPGIAISACATSQDSVADAMVALHRIVGVSQVSLSTSSKGGGGSAGGGSCSSRLPVNFQVDLSFSPPTEGSTTRTSDVSPSSTGSQASSSEVPQ